MLLRSREELIRVGDVTPWSGEALAFQPLAPARLFIGCTSKVIVVREDRLHGLSTSGVVSPVLAVGRTSRRRVVVVEATQVGPVLGTARRRA